MGLEKTLAVPIEPDDSVVDEVVHAMRGPDEHGESEAVYFEYGKKILRLDINRAGAFTTYVKTLPGAKETSWETTVVYKAARKYMQRIADESGRVFKYTLRTSFETMKDWARSSGAQIFHWTNTWEREGERASPSFFFEADIVPTKNPSHLSAP